jgi:hypothetical protein
MLMAACGTWRHFCGGAGRLSLLERSGHAPAGSIGHELLIRRLKPLSYADGIFE